MVAPEMALTPSKDLSLPWFWSVYSGFAVLPPRVAVSPETSRVEQFKMVPSLSLAHKTEMVPRKPLPSAVKT